MRLDYKVTGIADINAVLRDVGPREGRNLMRATVFDIAKQLAADASDRAPKDDGDLASGIKAKRERSPRDRANASVRAAPFYWRFLEYGDGPDGVEHAFFLKALQSMRPEMDRVYLEAFARKLAARMARERKRSGK